MWLSYSLALKLLSVAFGNMHSSSRMDMMPSGCRKSKKCHTHTHTHTRLSWKLVFYNSTSSCGLKNPLRSPFQWDRCKLEGPGRSRCRSTRCPPSCTPPAPRWTCGGWRTVAVSRLWSWCTAARSCWAAKGEKTRVLIHHNMHLSILHSTYGRRRQKTSLVVMVFDEK